MTYHLQRKVKLGDIESYREITADKDYEHIKELAIMKSLHDKTVRIIDSNGIIKWKCK